MSNIAALIHTGLPVEQFETCGSKELRAAANALIELAPKTLETGGPRTATDLLTAALRLQTYSDRARNREYRARKK